MYTIHQLFCQMVELPIAVQYVPQYPLVDCVKCAMTWSVFCLKGYILWDMIHT